MSKILNCTPHKVVVVDGEGKPLAVFQPFPMTARVKAESRVVETLGGGIPITETVFGEIEDLPYPQEDTYFIVSRIVKSAAGDRSDLLVPGDLVRDDDGNIIGCRSLDR